MNKDELEHVGVLGMRWGHRKGSSVTTSTGRRPVKGLGPVGTKYTFKKENGKTVVRNASTGRKLSAKQQKAFIRSFNKTRDKQIKDAVRKANTVAAVAAILGTIGTVALWKYSGGKLG